MTSREVARAARRLADQQKALATAQPTGRFWATITTFTPNGASDGGDLVKVTYQGTEVTAACYLYPYTPAIGDRVLCEYVESQLVVDGKPLGTP